MEDGGEGMVMLGTSRPWGRPEEKKRLQISNRKMQIENLEDETRGSAEGAGRGVDSVSSGMTSLLSYG